MAPTAEEDAAGPPASGGDAGLYGLGNPEMSAAITALIGREPTEAEIAIFPPDPPEGHEAHTVVRFSMGKWPLASFIHPTNKVRFQTTMLGSGSREGALRIARACYMMFDNGASLEQCKEFREGMYAKLKEARGEFKEPKEKPKKVKDPDAPVRQVQYWLQPGWTPQPDAYVQPPDDGDAPPEHMAHGVIRFDKANDVFLFYIPGMIPKSKFCLKRHKINDDEDEARRILRLCFMKFWAGAQREEVTDYRDGLVARYFAAQGKDAAAGKSSARRRTEEKGDAAEEKEKLGQTVGESRNVAAASTLAAQWEALATESAKSVALKFKLPGTFSFDNVPRSAGDTFKFQVSCQKTGGSSDAAERLIRLCLVKYEQGADRAALEEYRAEMYSLFNEGQKSKQKKQEEAADVDGEPPKKKRKQNKPAKNAAKGNEVTAVDAELAATLEKQGRLAGALEVKGREEQLKNSSINGVYAAVKEGFEGKPAYEKVDGSTERFLFYSSKKRKWKIHASLDDSAAGFAYAKCDGGKPPGGELRWHVFDGSSKGYNLDAAVRCQPLQGAARPAEDASMHSSSDSGSDSGEDSAGSAASPASGSSSSESGDEDARAAPPRAAVAAARGAGSARAPPVQSPAADLSGGAGTPSPGSVSGPELRLLRPPPPIDGKQQKVCAKMLVRSGLRCGCHFAYRAQCPG